MLPLTQLLLFSIVIIITIGITQVQKLLTILVGLHQKVLSQSTTHVQPVGVFPTVAKMVSGQGRWVQVHLLLKVHYTTLPTMAGISPASSAAHLPSGILLRVIAASTSVSTVSATTATIGLLLLAIAARTT